MMNWKRYPRVKKELMCEHGVGHGGMHGCDGCCKDPSFKESWKRIFGEDFNNDELCEIAKKALNTLPLRADDATVWCEHIRWDNKFGNWCYSTFGLLQCDHWRECPECLKPRPLTAPLKAEEEKPEWYSKGTDGTLYELENGDPEVSCWHCKKTFLCDPMDATCRLCGAPFDKKRCAEFGFKPLTEEEKVCCKEPES